MNRHISIGVGCWIFVVLYKIGISDGFEIVWSFAIATLAAGWFYFILKTNCPGKKDFEESLEFTFDYLKFIYKDRFSVDMEIGSDGNYYIDIFGENLTRKDFIKIKEIIESEFPADRKKVCKVDIYSYKTEEDLERLMRIYRKRLLGKALA